MGPKEVTNERGLTPIVVSNPFWVVISFCEQHFSFVIRTSIAIGIFLKDAFVPHSDRNDSTISTSLIDRAREGGDDAFRQITKLFGGLVYHWCRTAGLQPEDAEDVGQRVFMTVSRSIGSFRRDKPGDSFRGWLRVITRSRISDHYREMSKREVAYGGEGHWNESAFQAWEKEEPEENQRRDGTMIYQRAIQLMQGEFAEQDYKAFCMVVVDGLGAREVAEALGMTPNSVYIAKSRILKRLRFEFAELLDDDSIS